MREFTQRFNLSQGIKPVERPTRNGEALTVCRGLKPDNERLIPFDKIGWQIDPEEEVVQEFPYPQIYVGQRYSFLMTAADIYVIEGDGTLTELWGGMSEYQTWHVADFAEFVVFTNGLVTLCYPEPIEDFAEITCFQYW